MSRVSLKWLSLDLSAFGLSCLFWNKLSCSQFSHKFLYHCVKLLYLKRLSLETLRWMQWDFLEQKSAANIDCMMPDHQGLCKHLWLLLFPPVQIPEVIFPKGVKQIVMRVGVLASSSTFASLPIPINWNLYPSLSYVILDHIYMRNILMETYIFKSTGINSSYKGFTLICEEKNNKKWETQGWFNTHIWKLVSLHLIFFQYYYTLYEIRFIYTLPCLIVL